LNNEIHKTLTIENFLCVWRILAEPAIRNKTQETAIKFVNQGQHFLFIKVSKEQQLDGREGVGRAVGHPKYMHTYMYVCMYVCMYVYTCLRNTFSSARRRRSCSSSSTFSSPPPDVSY